MNNIIEYDSLLDEKDIEEYSIAKSHIIPKLVNISNNADWLGDAAHTVYLDTAVVFIYVIRAEGDEIVSFNINNEALVKWGVSVDTLLHDSIETAMRLFPMSIESIEDVLGLSENDYYQTFFVMSNSRRHFGAATMLYDNALDDFADQIHDSFSIIPSSIHEVLLVPDRLGISSDELSGMLTDVNISIVRDDEILSDRIYHYDLDTGSVSIM